MVLLLCCPGFKITILRKVSPSHEDQMYLQVIQTPFEMLHCLLYLPYFINGANVFIGTTTLHSHYNGCKWSCLTLAADVESNMEHERGSKEGVVELL